MKWQWLRHPVLHFVLIGVTLFGARVLWSPSVPERPPAKRQPIIVSAERIDAMQTDFSLRWGTAPTPEQMSALITQAVDEELLYREARMLALDFEDGSVRRRLVEKMRVLSTHPGSSPDELVREARALGLDNDVVIRRLLIEKIRILLARDPTAQQPTEEELQDYLQRHRDRFEQPAELTFSHIFLSETARGAQLETDARATLLQTRSLSPASSPVLDLSDPFSLGLQMHAYSRNRITARFGKPFADKAFALAPAMWSDPIASPYGLHLVWVEEKSAPKLPKLAAVRQSVMEGVQKERAAVQLRRGVARVRGLYEIRVDGREDLSTPGAALALQPQS